MIKKKLLIGFYAHGLSFHGNTLIESSLGGSETALLYMARELAKRGHDVKVFNNCPKPGRYDGVDYFNYATQWRDIAPVAEWDVFIVSRNYTFCAQKINARLVGLWNHDIATDKRSIMTNIWGADFVWCLSDFHINQFLGVVPELRPIMYKTRNGVDLQFIDSLKPAVETRTKNIFIWGSRPERGLDILLQKTWPRILKEVDANAVLLIAGYSVDGLDIPENVQQHQAFLAELIKNTPNVRHIGNLKKEDWYKHLYNAGMMLYPTRFPEISCIAAMEAQACGLPIITSDEFALKETVKDKHNRIKGHADSNEYQNAFIARVNRLYTSEFEYKQTQRIGREHIIHHYEWPTIAEEWESFFYERFQERSVRNGGRNSIRALIYKSDLLAAKWVLDNPDITGITLSECKNVQQEVEFFLHKHHENPEVYDESDLIHEELDTSIEAWDRIGRFNVACAHLKKHFATTPFSIIDIGCGAGRFMAKVLKEFPNQVTVSGIDFSEGLADRAGKLLLKLYPGIGDPKDFIQAKDFMTMDPPMESDKADAAFAGEWLEHQQDVYGALAKLEQCVKPGGFVVITIPSGPWEAISYKRNPENRYHVSHFEFRDIEELFAPKKFSMEYFPAGISPIDSSLLGNWVISWVADGQPFGTIDYLRKFTTIRPYQYISACMIVKDEEDYLSGCLKSIHLQVDEINILDTGSTDDTIAIAKKFTNRIKSVKWPNDFSEARNMSVAMANPEADWIYWMDADERALSIDRLRRYTNSELFMGYVITQNHLTIDMPNVKPDVPVRLYRNHSGIKFFGAIHEHCELALDTPIDPVLILPDVKIVHYGYISEYTRRQKCRDRNMDLLKIDREKYPDRILGIVLMMRDYLNLSQWEIERTHGEMTVQIITLLRDVVRLYRKFFTNTEHMYHDMAFSLYQRALASLGKNGFSIYPDNERIIPFEVKFALGGGVGGMLNPDNMGIDSVWFGDRDEFEQFMSSRAKTLADGLKLSKG